jgi:glutamate synthase domain-containing protein 3
LFTTSGFDVGAAVVIHDGPAELIVGQAYVHGLASGQIYAHGVLAGQTYAHGLGSGQVVFAG